MLEQVMQQMRNNIETEHQKGPKKRDKSGPEIYAEIGASPGTTKFRLPPPQGPRQGVKPKAGEQRRGYGVHSHSLLSWVWSASCDYATR